jgi:hypothetical protein
MIRPKILLIYYFSVWSMPITSSQLSRIRFICLSQLLSIPCTCLPPLNFTIRFLFSWFDNLIKDYLGILILSPNDAMRDLRLSSNKESLFMLRFSNQIYYKSYGVIQEIKARTVNYNQRINFINEINIIRN